MTPEAQNIAIAESLGWTSKKVPSDETVKAQGYEEFRHTWWTNPQGECPKTPPNYHGSLDACAEFEAKLNEIQKPAYAWYLLYVCDPDDRHSTLFTCASAKPAQRCEAYLRTIGKWRESN